MWNKQLTVHVMSVACPFFVVVRVEGLLLNPNGRGQKKGAHAKPDAPSRTNAVLLSLGLAAGRLKASVTHIMVQQLMSMQEEPIRRDKLILMTPIRVRHVNRDVETIS